MEHLYPNDIHVGGVVSYVVSVSVSVSVIFVRWGMGVSEEEEVGIRYVWRVYSRFFIFAFGLFAFCYFGVKYMNIHKDNTYLYR